MTTAKLVNEGEVCMAVELVYQVASFSELDEILQFAEGRLAHVISDPTERMFASWHAPWRREALEHYLKLGWSFTVRNKSEPGAPLMGFFLGQALLFLRGQTQTLWIEHIDAISDDARNGLTDVAVRLSREKHLQRVLFRDAESVKSSLTQFKSQPMPDSITEVFTTKG